MLSDHQREQTARSIIATQSLGGTIPWTAGGRWDPWDHLECAMALDAAGFHEQARAAFRHLEGTQRHDGAWACPIVGGDETDHVLDSNGASYLATGVWHHFLCTKNAGALHELWPAVERAVDFALGLQLPGGPILWARNLDGRAGDHAVLAGSSSIALSLRCALQICHELGEERPDWELSLVSLAAAIRGGDSAFADRSRYSMDWYYPVLSGALDSGVSRARLEQRWDAFVVDGLGARCVDDRPWITSAETAELAIASWTCGMEDEARALFGWVQYQRHTDGSYWTGATFFDGRHFPNERTNWSGAAMILADAVLSQRGAIAEIFRKTRKLPLASISSNLVELRARV